MKNLFLTACAVFLSISIIQAQETEEIKDNIQKQIKIGVKVKDDAKPDIYVDGKKFDFDVELLDQNKIESINVIKDEQAIKEYNAPNGVLLITTKKNIEINKTGIKIKAQGDANGNAPVIIINGKKSDQETLEKLSPDDVESIEVFKDEAAIEKYNAPNGAVIITTKKK